MNCCFYQHWCMHCQWMYMVYRARWDTTLSMDQILRGLNVLETPERFSSLTIDCVECAGASVCVTEGVPTTFVLPLLPCLGSSQWRIAAARGANSDDCGVAVRFAVCGVVAMFAVFVWYVAVSILLLLCLLFAALLLICWMILSSCVVCCCCDVFVCWCFLYVGYCVLFAICFCLLFIVALLLQLWLCAIAVCGVCLSTRSHSLYRYKNRSSCRSRC